MDFRAQQEKPRTADVILAIVCGLVVFFWFYYAQAQEPTFSLNGPDGKLTLTAEPCPHHPWLKDWQLARWLYKGKGYEACWRAVGGGEERLIVVLDSAGDITAVPPQAFAKDEPL